MLPQVYKVNRTQIRCVMLYGIQPTGCPHLGNLLCLQLARAQRTHKWVCCIADLHALTSRVNARGYRNRVRLAAAFVLAGVPSSKCIVYIQSRSLAQTWLLWIISCLSKLPELERASAAERANVGHTLYPSLMSADVLACRATHLVVGCDQKKHLEYVRLISNRINALTRLTLNTDRELVPKPKSCFGQSIKLMSLQTPTVKMSKSSDCELGCVYVLDDYAVIRSKVARAKTDAQSWLPSDAPGLNNRLGLTNLIEAYALTAGLSLRLLLARIGKVNIKSFKRWLAKLLYAKARRTSLATKQWLRKPEALDRVLASDSNLIAQWSSCCVNHIKLVTELK
ncbi:MAG: Tryptophan--tRNA ligase [Candidatus Hodgkinia cicadicola]|nr:MAG: Tryptophan--tRNA ligase [Candidatus Hodgkinia cicadicola]